jgi:hypothetical protein
LLRITNPVSDLTRAQEFYVIVLNCDSGIHHAIFSICMGDSAHTTHHTNTERKSAPPLFLEDDNIFQKSATLVLSGIVIELIPTWQFFEKCSYLRGKGGLLMLFKTIHHL